MSEIRAILVPLDEAALERRVLERALALGRRFDAVVEALHISPLPRPNDPGWEALTKRGMGFALTEDAMREAMAAEERMRGEYEKIRRRGEAPETAAAGRRFAARFAVAGGAEDLVVATRARVSDLVVAARGGAEGEVSETIEAVLTEGGRPILVLPPGELTPLDGTCVLAWNGRPEAARALAFALPFLRAAAATVVVEVDEAGTRRGVGAGSVAHYLAQHGVEARDHNADKRGSIGETLVRATHEHEANLLVMGGAAYSRVRRMIFGHVTRDVIETADFPLLMAN